MNRVFFNTLFMAVLTTAAAAAEEAPPLNLKGIYEFQFAGAPVGIMGVEAEQSAAHYSITADIQSAGMVKLFTQHSSHTVVESGDGAIRYETHYRTKNKKKSVAMTQKNGEWAEENVQPPENPAKRPPVPAELKKGAFDPLSLNLALRERVWQALSAEQKNFTVKVYDGRRLTQVDATVAGKYILKDGGKKIPTIRVAARRKLLAGFTASELKSYDPKEPTLWIYYSDDGRLVPLKLETKFLFGKLTATLAKECLSGESCLLGIRE